MEWEKIYANYVSHKGSVFRIYKGLLQLNNNKNNSKMGKGVEKTCLPKRCTNGQRAHEKKFNITNH